MKIIAKEYLFEKHIFKLNYLDGMYLYFEMIYDIIIFYYFDISKYNYLSIINLFFHSNIIL